MHPIRDYFLIGDLQTAALVGPNASIDWLCLPYFDSPSVFGALLDKDKGGTFRLEMPGYEQAMRYLPYTAIVETSFASKDASFSVRDFMLPRPTDEVVPHYLIRKITGVSGKHTARFIFDPRPNYARQRAVLRQEEKHISLRIEDRMLLIHLPDGARMSQVGQNEGVIIEIDIEAGETKHLILEYSVSSKVKQPEREWEQETAEFWKEWITEGNFEFSREHLVRSAITLKLMQFYPTGGLVAAPTTSLPEEMGGIRNWDYRYVWLRDATFHLYAFSVLGFTKEAVKFFEFIETIAEGAKRCDDGVCDLDLSVMYTIWGQPLQGEAQLDHLAGYGDSKPVRIGNGAAEQFQLDAYGSLIDAYYFMSRRGLPLTANGKDIIQMLVSAIDRNWERKDSGIWEVRGGDQHFAYSKMMAWLGVERALRLSEELGISDATKKKWHMLQEKIGAWIWANCFDAKRGTFVQHPDTKAQDATNFLFILLFFLSRHDPKAASVVEETRKELARDDLFIYRYLVDDGLAGGEGAFALCTFWQIAAMAAVGRGQEADALLSRFETMMPASGLIAEEIDPKTGEYLGNFPQAFSHIGYILSTYYIHRYRKKD